VRTTTLRDSLTWDEKILQLLLLSFSLTLPISISLAEPLVFLAIPLWVYGLISRRDASLFQCPYFWPVAIFALIALLSSLWGVRPEVSLMKCHRLFLLSVVFMMGTAFRPDCENGWEKVRLSVVLFVAGTTLRAIYDVVRVAIEVGRGVPLYDTGNMRDPQMYLVSSCFLLAAFIGRGRDRRNHMAPLLLGLNAIGLILHFKRGVWFSILFSAGLMSWLARRRKIVMAVVLSAVALAFVPQVRNRMELLKKEWSDNLGGRHVLWTQVAPAMLKQYPLGMGFKATKHEDFLPYAAYVQPKLDHLHNNVLQVTLEMGSAGLAAWLGWMAMTFWMLYKASYGRAGEAAELALGALGAFCGLMFNGMVEYNFGDSEILMLLCFLMGLSWVIHQKPQAESPS
jgi:O-antigen ligase